MSETRLQIKFGDSAFWLAVFTGILAVIAAAALWIANSQLKESHEEAQIQHLLTLTQQFEQDPMATYRRQLAEKRLRNEKDPEELYNVLNFFDTVGLLVDRGYLNESDVWDTFSYWVFNVNSDARDIIEQEQRADPNAYSRFTSLVGRLQRIEVQHHGTGARPTKDEVMDFYRSELTTGIGKPLGRRVRSSKRPEKQ